MAKKILIIDADRASARDAATALEARGAETRICGDGQLGVEEARSWLPDLAVVCVELPGLSGYSICNKLKKDEQLRATPVVLTSAAATSEAFEQHRKLRTRAEEYLLKPLAPDALVQVVSRFVELLPEPVRPARFEGVGEDDLQLIDRVFDELAAGPEPDGRVSPRGRVGAPIAAPAPAPAPPASTRAEAPAPGGAPPVSATEVERLRARVADLEAELKRVAAELAAANADRARVANAERALERAVQSERAATERAVAVEARLRQADALRDKARRALAVVLQALEEPGRATPPPEVTPRRE